MSSVPARVAEVVARHPERIAIVADGQLGVETTLEQFGDQGTLGGVAAIGERQPECGRHIVEQLQVLGRAGGAAQLHLDAVLGQRLGVALAEFGVGALVGAGGQHHLLGRVRVQHLVGDGQQHQGQQDEGAGGGEQVAHRQQGVAQGLGHGRSRVGSDEAAR